MIGWDYPPESPPALIRARMHMNHVDTNREGFNGDCRLAHFQTLALSGGQYPYGGAPIAGGNDADREPCVRREFGEPATFVAVVGC
jgi:hypothetical protein